MSGGVSLHGLPFAAFSSGVSSVELRAGWNQHLYSYADTSGGRGLLEVAARASTGTGAVRAQLRGGEYLALCGPLGEHLSRPPREGVRPGLTGGDAGPALFLTTIESMNLSLVWFGIVTVIGAEIGLLTPPLGLSVFRQPLGGERPAALDLLPDDGIQVLLLQ